MLKAVTEKPAGYEVLSNADGSEVKDHEGKICFWCKNKHINKIERKEIIVYKDVTKSNLTPREWYFVINYFARYYNTFYGDIIKITYIQDDFFWHSIGKEKRDDARGCDGENWIIVTSAADKNHYWSHWTFPDEHSRYYQDEDVF